MKNYQSQKEALPAMGGFFSWLRRNIIKVVTAVAQVSVNPFFLVNIMEDAFDGGGFNFGNPNDQLMQRTIAEEEIPLTAQDEQMLDAWVDNKFTPFFKTYFSKIKEFNEVPPTLNTFILYYEGAQDFIALLNWYKGYVLTNREGAFSTNALRARNQFLDVQIELLNAEINKYITTVDATLTTSTIQKSVNSRKYLPLGFNLPVNINLSSRKINRLETVDTNTGGVEIFEPTPIGTTTNNPKDEPVKKNGGGVVFLALIGLFGLWAMSNTTEDVKKGSDKKQKA